MSDSDAVGSEPVALSVGAVRPSQLYLDGDKLAEVARWFDFAEPSDDPLRVREIAGRWTLTDGHTRAFAAALAGAPELRVGRDDDELPMDAYRTCVEWCEAEGVTEIADLTGRVLNPDDFEARWIDRCRRLLGERSAVRSITPAAGTTPRRATAPRRRTSPGPAASSPVRGRPGARPRRRPRTRRPRRRC